MWDGMMWPSLETTPKTITLAGNFVFFTLGTSLLFVAIQICILRVLAMVLLSWQRGREDELYSGASPISLVEHCVTFRHDRRLLSLLGFVLNWPTTRWSATEKENWFSLNGNGIMWSFLGRQFYCSTLYILCHFTFFFWSLHINGFVLLNSYSLQQDLNYFLSWFYLLNPLFFSFQVVVSFLSFSNSYSNISPEI